MPQKRRAGHHDIGAGQQILDDFVGALDPGAGGERRTGTPCQERNPEQRQADLGCGAELKTGRQRKPGEIDIWLVKAIEEHQPICTGFDQLAGHVAHGAEIGAQLDCDRNLHSLFYGFQDGYVAMLDLVPGNVERGGNEVDIELNRIGTRLLNLLRIVDPAVISDAIEAGDNRDIDCLYRTTKNLEIAPGGGAIRSGRRKIGQRFGIAVNAGRC